MRYECDCGAVYADSAAVLMCGSLNHGNPRKDPRDAQIVALVGALRDTLALIKDGYLIRSLANRPTIERRLAAAMLVLAEVDKEAR